MNLAAWLCCGVAFGSLRGFNLTEPTQGADKRSLTGKRLDTWETIIDCGMLDAVTKPASEVVRVRICSKGSETDCVISKSTLPLEHWRRFGTMNSNAGQCDMDCVKKNWEGPELLLHRLKHWCLSTTDGMHGLYHACGNTQGLHLMSSDWCTWGNVGDIPIVVQGSRDCPENKYKSDGVCTKCRRPLSDGSCSPEYSFGLR